MPELEINYLLFTVLLFKGLTVVYTLTSPPPPITKYIYVCLLVGVGTYMSPNAGGEGELRGLGQ